LRWRDAGNDEYGVELQRRDGDGFVRVALLDPGTTIFVHHGRGPDSELVYRVRAFNPAGASASSNDATVRTAKVSDHPTPLSTFTNRQEMDIGLQPCTTPAAVRKGDEGDENRPPLEGRLEYGQGAVLDLFADPDSCGNANCNWVAYGKY